MLYWHLAVSATGFRNFFIIIRKSTADLILIVLDVIDIKLFKFRILLHNVYLDSCVIFPSFLGCTRPVKSSERIFTDESIHSPHNKV